MLKLMCLPSHLPLLWPLFPHLLALAMLGTWKCWEIAKRLNLIQKNLCCSKWRWRLGRMWIKHKCKRVAIWLQLLKMQDIMSCNKQQFLLPSPNLTREKTLCLFQWWVSSAVLHPLVSHQLGWRWEPDFQELQAKVWVCAGAHLLREQLAFLQLTRWELQLTNAIKVTLLFILFSYA